MKRTHHTETCKKCGRSFNVKTGWKLVTPCPGSEAAHKMRKNQKKQAQVYIVSGSEDGIIGVYKTLKRAKEEAHAYASQKGCREVADEHHSDYGGYYLSADGIQADYLAEVVQS